MIAEQIEIEHHLADQLVCPYCGYRSTDSHDHFPSSEIESYGAETACEDCGKDFTAQREVKYYFSSFKSAKKQT